MADTDMVVSEIFDNNIVKLYEGIATGVNFIIFFFEIKIRIHF